MEDDYRTRLSTVVSVARILLEEGLPFRGHDESAESLHRGNFLEHISWVCKREENVNKVMGKNALGNNQLTSPTIQRDIIECCAMETRKIILNELGEKKFTLLVDEARDCSVKEQMSLVLRFVNDKGMVLERFLGLVHVNETSAKVLKNAIDTFFAKHDLSLAKLRGQGYDGAANMSGEFNGLKTLILKENKNAHYIHCFAHQLQLVVVTASHESESVGGDDRARDPERSVEVSREVMVQRRDVSLQVNMDEESMGESEDDAQAKDFRISSSGEVEVDPSMLTQGGRDRNAEWV
ncbi:zinc finger MYM-type protein 1-like [Manihot esculenta]|uniref:zinc finger MYM-type protein 1-like n=1 Tax=Manihot esculenta TaxID=3983 RepID=UPI001CC65669|nr:zinc finger MYM-type protein 1-like [Manihot esculenta]